MQVVLPSDLVLTAADMREWDRFTMEHEPVSAIDLMERAAWACTTWIEARVPATTPIVIICGKGNNGGDGLAVARLLSEKGFEVSVHILEFGKPGSEEFQTNLHRLHAHPAVSVRYIQSAARFPLLPAGALIVDSLFGTGLRSAPEGLAADLIRHLNDSGLPIVSIDLPSGLAADGQSTGSDAVIRARYTLSFQAYKPALLLSDHALSTGEVHLLDIRLHPGFPGLQERRDQMLTFSFARDCYRPRLRFSHKGDFGHALLAAGSWGKMGAAIMSAAACLRSGVGLLTCLAPECGMIPLQTTVPEAMVATSGDRLLEGRWEGGGRYAALGLGPGIGTDPATAGLIESLLRPDGPPMVIDADGLNLLSRHPKWYDLLPSETVLTPHPKEFDRLFGNHQTDAARLATAVSNAAERRLVIVLKGHHTAIATPGRKLYFNTTGNAGMARGGSGDVLTGILTALLAQGYDAVRAATFGVFLHGLAGDLAAEELGMDSMTPMDLIRHLPAAFRGINTSG